MRNIAIVEDEDIAAQALEAHIVQYEKNSGQQFNVVRFRDAVEFLTGYQPLYSVVFMDIQMPHRDGMSAAVDLRRRGMRWTPSPISSSPCSITISRSNSARRSISTS